MYFAAAVTSAAIAPAANISAAALVALVAVAEVAPPLLRLLLLRNCAVGSLYPLCAIDSSNYNHVVLC